jgi:hypothetical protein
MCIVRLCCTCIVRVSLLCFLAGLTRCRPSQSIRHLRFTSRSCIAAHAQYSPVESIMQFDTHSVIECCKALYVLSNTLDCGHLICPASALQLFCAPVTMLTMITYGFGCRVRCTLYKRGSVSNSASMTETVGIHKTEDLEDLERHQVGGG